MDWGFLFFLNSALLGVGLAMDAFSVSLSNGLNEKRMKWPRMCAIAGVFAFFQFLMPLTGWLCVHTIAEAFQSFRKFIPWIALVLLLYIGGKMILDAIRGEENGENPVKLTFAILILQGIATSIDALSVGFTISSYRFRMAFVCSVIIAVVTFAICIAGLLAGRKFGTVLADKAGILGGTILILIGIEISVSSLF